MPKQYDNTNRGVLFRETDKESEKHPDYSGKLNVDGTEFYLAGWIKEPKGGGAKFLSLAVKPAKPGKKKDESDVPF